MTDTSAKAQSQKAAILAHLQTHGSITMPESLNLYGCEALRSRIADLRRDKVPIETRLVPFVSRFGHRGKRAEYRLTKQPPAPNLP